MEKNQNSGMSRREFLKTSALLGAMLSVAPLAGACASKTGAVPVPEKNDPAGRTLGRGAAAFRVSSLGFGCMGLCYNRSWHPNEKMEIRLVHEAIERGVTLFDTAEAYGPYKMRF